MVCLLKSADLIIVVAVLCYGCSTTRQLTSPLEANRKVGEGNATMNLRSGATYDGREVQFGMDSTRFFNRSNDSLVWVLTKDVKSVGANHRFGGALEGLILGGFGGAGVGLLAGSGMHSGGEEGMGKGLLLLATSFLGATGGLAVGVIKGHDYTFLFPHDSLKYDSLDHDSFNRDSATIENQKPIRKSQSENRFEMRVGWEIYRQSLVGILGYIIPLGASWSIVPELHYVAVLTPAVSARYEVPISDNLSLCVLGGVGVNFPPSPPPITGIVAISAMLETSEKFRWSIEGRIIAPALDYMQNYEVGGTLSISKMRSLLYYPPLVISLGFEF